MSGCQLAGAFVLLVSSVAGGFAADNEEAIAIKFVESLGRRVQRDPQDPKGPVIGADLNSTIGGGIDGQRPPLTDADLVRLRAFTQLQKLDLSSTNIGDSGLPGLHGLNRLRILDLSRTRVSDAGLKDLKDLPVLRELRLEGVITVTGSGLAELRDLQVLYLHHTGANDKGMRGVSRLTKLKQLMLYGTEVGDAGLNELRGLSELEELALGRFQRGGRRLKNGEYMVTPVTDVGMKQLRPLTNLKVLKLCGVRVTDAGIQELATLSQLEDLDLGDTLVTDAGLKSLKGLTKLRVLSLGSTAVSDAGLAELSGLKNLETLELEHTAVTDEGLKALRTLIALKYVDASNTKVTLKGGAKLKKFVPHATIDSDDSGVDLPPPHKRTPVGEVLLLEQAMKTFRKVDQIELPNRVYLKMSSKHGKVLHFLSNPEGGLGDCEEVLLPGTVVRGDRIGGSRKRYYQLTAVPNWKRVENLAECREVYLTQDDDQEGLQWESSPRDESAPRIKLGEAQEAFRDNLNQVRDQVMPELNAEEEAAKSAGKVEQVAEIQRRRQAFLLSGAIPEMPAKSKLEQQMRIAVAEIEEAFDKAQQSKLTVNPAERA